MTDIAGNSELSQIVAVASGRADVRWAVQSIYQTLQTEIDARKPICIASGRCCQFEKFGHRLFVTTMELADFVFQFRQSPREFQNWNGLGCPFQVGKLCGVRTLRPMGCRIFFCDATSETWQQSLYERLHAELKSEHARLNVPYRYIEWRAALIELGLANQP